MSYQQFKPSSYKLLPDVVKNLLIINGILFLAEIVLGDKFGFSLNQKFGLYYPGSENFHWTQFLTHLFLHGSFMHIFSNMFALWMFGNALENLWGSKRFLIYYLVCGLGAALIHTIASGWEINQMQSIIDQYAANPSFVDFESLIKKYSGLVRGSGNVDYFNNVYSHFQMYQNSPEVIKESVNAAYQLIKVKADIPTVGASGAVFGVLLAFGMLFPNTLIYLYFAIPIKAKYFVILYGLFELYSGFQNDPADNVAHFAHIGGMLFGFVLIKIWNKNNREHFY